MVGDQSFFASVHLGEDGGFHPEGGETEVGTGDSVNETVLEIVTAFEGFLMD